MPFFEGDGSGRRKPPPVAKKPRASGGFDVEEDRLNNGVVSEAAHSSVAALC